MAGHPSLALLRSSLWLAVILAASLVALAQIPPAASTRLTPLVWASTVHSTLEAHATSESDPAKDIAPSWQVCAGAFSSVAPAALALPPALASRPARSPRGPPVGS